MMEANRVSANEPMLDRESATRYARDPGDAALRGEPSSGGTSATQLPAEPAPPRPRTPMLVLALALASVAIAAGWYLLSRGRESTDDAQIEGHVVNVLARTEGEVVQVHVRDNQVVAQGDLLVSLDDAQQQAKLASARAELAAARANVDSARGQLELTRKSAPAGYSGAKGGLTAALSAVRATDAQIEQSHAELAAASSRLSLAQTNLTRAQGLFKQGALSQLELDTRQFEFDNAAAAAELARARVRAADAARSGSDGNVALANGRLQAAETSAEQTAVAAAALALAEANLTRAEAAARLAELNLSYTLIRAPRAGMVSRRTVEQGQYVTPTRPLLALVPQDDVWVVANFKEDQLLKMRAGQRVAVTTDTYGRREFSGHLESIAGGTGSRFALLPPDNASGNFVKVTQRVPVLVRLEPVTDVVLRPGMSAEVTVWFDEPSL